MKKISTVMRLLVFTLFLSLGFTACLKENTDDCTSAQPKVRIVVTTLAEQTREGDNGQIDNVVIYIFDADNYYVGSWQGGEYKYGETYIAEMELDPGSYHFVVWTNQLTAYFTSEGHTSTDKLVVALDIPENKTVDYDIPDLHHGMLRDAEVVPNDENEFTIIIRPDTYRLNFTVLDLPPTAGEYGFTVRDNNSHYLFDNTIVEGTDEFEYVRTATFEGEELAATIKVLKLADDRQPLFTFTDLTGGRTLHEDDLVSMIKKAYASAGHTVDFDTEFEFDITLRFDDQLNVTVTVNGWTYTDNPTEL